MIQIEAYAVVCENDCIADVNGLMPPALKNDAEWAFFQDGLARADVAVLGRKSHEITPNPKQRRRLVLSRQIGRAEWQDTRTVMWNPDGASLELALGMFDTPTKVLAITGGQGVFDCFLARVEGYWRFHLSRLTDVYLKDGVKLFSALNAGGQTPESVLKDAGYVPGAYRKLDQQASVVSWQKSF